MEFFLGCYEFIEGDLIRVVKTTRNKRKILRDYNIATFIALIQKEDNPTTFEKIWPISLCNCIYKSSKKFFLEYLKGYYQNKYLKINLSS